MNEDNSQPQHPAIFVLNNFMEVADIFIVDLWPAIIHNIHNYYNLSTDLEHQKIIAMPFIAN